MSCCIVNFRCTYGDIVYSLYSRSPGATINILCPSGTLVVMRAKVVISCRLGNSINPERLKEHIYSLVNSCVDNDTRVPSTVI